MDKKSKALPYVAASITVLLWASVFPAVRYTVMYYSPEALMVFRFLVASTVLGGYCLIKKVELPKKEDMSLFLISGVVGFFAYMWVFNAGVGLVLSGVGSFIISSSPVLTLLLSIVFLKEKTTLPIWLGVGVSFVGMVIIGATQVTEMELNFGVLLLLLAALLLSVYFILQRRILQKYNAMQATAYPLIFGTMPMLVFAPRLVSEFSISFVSANITVLYLGVFPAVLAYLFWIYALSKAEKTIYVTNFMYLVPFLAALMAFLWLGEEMPMLAFVGGFIVIAGMLIINVTKNRKF